VLESFFSSQSHTRFESESSKIFSSRVMTWLSWVRVESWLGWVESETSHKNCRVTSSHWFASSSHGQVKWNFTFFLWLFYAM